MTDSRPTRILNYNLVLLGIIIALFFLNFYSKTLFYGPFSTHQWRQSDCISITKNYYEEGMNFFEPKINYQGPKGGKAVSEMPVLNYTVAALWKVFGEHEFIYRLLEYLIYLTAIFVLFNTIGTYLRSWILAFFSVFLLQTSPLLTFYSLNFIADVPALSLGIISFCLFYRFYQNQRLLNFYLSLIIGTLAVLLKASAAIPIGILIFFSLAAITGLHRVLKTKKLFDNIWPPLVTILISVMLVVTWYRWALVYNLHAKNAVFLLTVLPIWEMDEVEIIRNLKILSGDLFPLFLNRPMLFLFFMLVFYVIGNFKKLSHFLRYTFVFTAIYFVAYLVFFFKVFSVHDYYLNNLMVFPVVTLFCFAELNMETGFVVRNRAFVRIFLVVTFLFNSFYAAAVYRLRMIEDDKLCQWFPFVSEEDRKIHKYYFWDYSRDMKNIKGLTPKLRAHGVKREDLVITVPDQSFNITLYMMDQKGYGISREHFVMDPNVTDHFRSHGIRYFILSDSTLKAAPAFNKIAPFLEGYFRHGKVQVFKVKPGY